MMGLLGESDDPLDWIGLGIGASDRARELVLKGLLAEIEEEWARLKPKPKRGRPTKSTSIDLIRADRILGVQKLYRSRGHEITNHRKLLDGARQIENILIAKGKLDEKDRVFDNMTSEATLLNSISRGLKALDEDSDLS